MQTIDKDLSNLTTISVASIQKILSKFQDAICFNLQESLETINDFVELDIYIGKLIIRIEDNKIYYKFIPSPSFEEDIKSTIENNECPLIKKLENSITEKIKSAYKEFY